MNDVAWVTAETSLFLALFKLIALVIRSLFFDKKDSPYDKGESPEEFGKRHDIL